MSNGKRSIRAVLAAAVGAVVLSGCYAVVDDRSYRPGLHHRPYHYDDDRGHRHRHHDDRDHRRSRGRH